MTDKHILRIGGISGILFVILFIPSYLSAPDSPSLTSSAQQLLDHLVSRQDEIIFLNGVLLIFAAFFFLFGPLGGWLVMAWIVVVSVLMLIGTVGRPVLVARP